MAQSYQYPHVSVGGSSVGTSNSWELYQVHSPSSPAKATPFSTYLKIPFTLLKVPVDKKVVRSLITSLWTSLTILMCGISVLCITKKLRISWHNPHKRIHFFGPQGIITSSTYHSTTLGIIKKYITCGQIDVYPLTHPYPTALLPMRRVILVPTNDHWKKSNTSLSRFKWTNAIVLRLSHNFFHPHYQNYKFLTSHSLTFNPACAIYKQPPPAITHS